ncbi:hypothetical protein ASPVEDRAFT_832447 [Aspergillus versicolor CBS 583.65]|uniref:Uncharacterized protein n=1 Tax=Aspergillus versicolor CBS 583.65 TaxID=1036611 RepID=A0A1L9PUI0_ASPVE|nr:uncharacterized protein ASPVEDRAFT_832447 [Aspergillus versicolor CBS 583.65]OJJ05085.1 hypothetical protein ASPVEDRAFT_832447 [Aspergillus versicolor CBS 583.65]
MIMQGRTWRRDRERRSRRRRTKADERVGLGHRTTRVRAGLSPSGNRFIIAGSLSVSPVPSIGQTFVWHSFTSCQQDPSLLYEIRSVSSRSRHLAPSPTPCCAFPVPNI